MDYLDYKENIQSRKKQNQPIKVDQFSVHTTFTNTTWPQHSGKEQLNFQQFWQVLKEICTVKHWLAPSNSQNLIQLSFSGQLKVLARVRVKSAMRLWKHMVILF